MGLRIHALDPTSLHLKEFSDSSFGNAEKGHSQLKYLIYLCDVTKKSNLLCYLSSKSRLVVRSILGGETYAFADALDAAFMLSHDLKNMTNASIPISIFTD